MGMNDPKVIAHLLRSIAGGATAQAHGHDIILIAAADLLDPPPQPPTSNEKFFSIFGPVFDG